MHLKAWKISNKIHLNAVSTVLQMWFLIRKSVQVSVIKQADSIRTNTSEKSNKKYGRKTGLTAFHDRGRIQDLL